MGGWELYSSSREGWLEIGGWAEQEGHACVLNSAVCKESFDLKSERGQWDCQV